MINWAYFPRNENAPLIAKQVVTCFESVASAIDSTANNQHIAANYKEATSNAVLSQLRLGVASRMIVRPFYKQMRMRSVPVFHGPHWGFALERRLG